MHPLRAAAAVLAVALAGCAAPDEPVQDRLGPDSFTLTVSGVPGTVVAGQEFTFEMQVAGSPAVASDHIGAHHWSTPQSDPTMGLPDGAACSHLESPMDVPGMFPIRCRIDTVGDRYLYGHLRLKAADGSNLDFWAPPHPVTVVPI